MKIEFFVERINQLSNSYNGVKELKGPNGYEIQQKKEFDIILADLKIKCDSSFFLSEIFPSMSRFFKKAVVEGTEITKDSYKEWFLQKFVEDSLCACSFNDFNFLTSFIKENIIEFLEHEEAMVSFGADEIGKIALDALYEKASVLKESQIIDLLKYMYMPDDEIEPMEFITTYGVYPVDILKERLSQNKELKMHQMNPWTYLTFLSNKAIEPLKMYDVGEESYGDSYSDEWMDDFALFPPKKAHLVNDENDINAHNQSVGCVAEEDSLAMMLC